MTLLDYLHGKWAGNDHLRKSLCMVKLTSQDTHSTQVTNHIIIIHISYMWAHKHTHTHTHTHTRSTEYNSVGVKGWSTTVYPYTHAYTDRIIVCFYVLIPTFLHLCSLDWKMIQKPIVNIEMDNTLEMKVVQYRHT